MLHCPKCGSSSIGMEEMGSTPLKRHRCNVCQHYGEVFCGPILSKELLCPKCEGSSTLYRDFEGRFLLACSCQEIQLDTKSFEESLTRATRILRVRAGRSEKREVSPDAAMDTSDPLECPACGSPHVSKIINEERGLSHFVCTACGRCGASFYDPSLTGAKDITALYCDKLCMDCGCNLVAYRNFDGVIFFRCENTECRTIVWGSKRWESSLDILAEFLSRAPSAPRQKGLAF